MKNQIINTLSHKTCYASYAERHYPVIYTCTSDGSIKKSFLPNVSVPVTFNGFSTVLRTYKFESDTFNGLAVVKCAFGVFYYSLQLSVDSLPDLRSIGFVSFENCISALLDTFRVSHWNFKVLKNA